MTRFDSDEFYVALDRQRRDRHLSWRAVAAEAGVSPSSFTRIAYGHGPDVNNLILMLLWLGTTDIKPFIRTEIRGDDD